MSTFEPRMEVMTFLLILVWKPVYVVCATTRKPVELCGGSFESSCRSKE